MIASFMRSGLRVDVLEFLQRLVEMAPNYVRR
jgi:hypothetical protein